MSRKSFWSCRSGNVGLMFALAIVPVIGAIGLAVDYSMAASARYRLQNAIDATALSLAHAKADLTDAELQARAELVFAQNFSSDDSTTLGPIAVKRGTDYITVNASAVTKTSFSRVVGVNTLDVASAGKVVWGPVRVEVVLALDNTYSMNDNGKMTQLKLAAKKLVDILESVEEKQGDVKIGIVPFGRFVRVDSASLTPINYKGATWIHFPSTTETVEDKTKCVDYKKNGKDCKTYGTKTVVTPFVKDGWSGCIQDRDQNYDTNDEYSLPIEASKYPAVTNDECGKGDGTLDMTKLATVRPLGWDYSAIRSAIQGMTPTGSTNTTMGFQWGMALLSHKEPFTQGVDPATEKDDGKTQKVLIVLTDGTNTQSRYQTTLDTRNGWKKIDPRSELACAEAKKVATVYTIKVIDGNETMLRKCASTTDKFYDVDNADELTPVFQKIGDEISKLRVSS